MVNPDLDPSRICLFVSSQTAVFIYLGISLLFDGMAFLAILRYSFKNTISLRASTVTLFGTIVRDGTIYFFVIFTSNLVWLVTMASFKGVSA